MTPILGLRPGNVALAVATHPDDETLGAGGTINRLSRSGVAVHVLAITCISATMRAGHSDAALRAKEFAAACDALGVAGRTIAWIDDERARYPHRYQRDLVSLIEHGTELSLMELRPDLLLIPAATGFHQDHQIVHEAAFSAARAGGSAKHTPRLVLGFAGPEDGWTTATEPWRVYVETTTNWPAKQAALTTYASQLREPPHPRSVAAIRTLDAANGITVGMGMAERFVPYRVVV